MPLSRPALHVPRDQVVPAQAAVAEEQIPHVADRHHVHCLTVTVRVRLQDRPMSVEVCPVNGSTAPAGFSRFGSKKSLRQ